MMRKMKQKENNELIDHIKEQLKAFEETPYRQGAWESYKAAYETTRKKRRSAAVYWSAAAAVLLMGFGGLFFYNQYTNKQPVEGRTAIAAIVPQDTAAESAAADTNSKATAEMNEQPSAHLLAGLTNTIAEKSIAKEVSFSAVKHVYLSSMLSDMVLSTATPQLTEVKAKHYAIQSPIIVGVADESSALAGADLGTGFVMAQQQHENKNFKESNNLALAPKKVNILNKLALGVFLSPTSTSSKLDLGGGLVLGYQLSKKLVLRTGAAFNQYEVGILPHQLKGDMMASANDFPVSQGFAADVPYRTASPALPNINAITGKVQTLDIPLEVAYKFDNNYYTSVGVSYAAVLSQERFNHYQEKAGAALFSSESGNGEPVNEVRTVAKKVASTVDNVETNGFGGFINLSLGRRANVGKGLKVSVEPFVKIPVGQFKRTDMNYTNGGVKVITSF